MAQQKRDTFGPIALTATLTTNLIAPAAAGAGGVGYTPTADRITILRLHFVNKTAAAHTVTLYKGATGANAAGTEVFVALSIAANSTYDYYVPIILEGANGFLVGGADALTAIVMYADVEIGKV